MKNRVIRRLLVGAIALTTFFSTFDSAVSFAVDGGTVVASDHQENDSDVSLKGVSFAEEVDETADDSSAASSEEGTQAAEGSSEEPQESASEGSGEASEDASSSENSTENTSNPTEGSSEASSIVSSETSSEVPTEAPAEASSEKSEEAPSEDASTESSSAEDAADEASSEASEESAAEAASEASSEAPKDTTPEEKKTPINDLSNPDFGKVDNFKLPDEIGSIDDEISLSFDFHVYDAESIPDGVFTYTLPDALDFSGILNKTIEVKEGDQVIGTAVFTSPHVITFKINKDYLENKPNGINGSVKLECKIANGGDIGDEPITIEFPGGPTEIITVKKPVITAKKDPVAIRSGEAAFKVVFDVSADTDDFRITDVLGENLEFIQGSWSFSREDYSKVTATFELADAHTLNVNVGKIKKGRYVLRYTAKATKIQDAVAADAIEKGYGNTAKWQWKGCTGEHEVISYATCVDNHYWLSKTRSGSISADGVATWIVYVNGGNPMDISGMTLVDVLDERMDFSDIQVEIEYSKDAKTWKHFDYTSDIKKEGNNWVLRYTFPENSLKYGYRLKYTTKIKDLPSTKTKYNNEVYLYKGEELVDKKSATQEYTHAGKIDYRIEKNVFNKRDASGIVTWKTDFYVNGDRTNYGITITDSIAPASDTGMIAGKKIGVKMLEGIELYKVDAEGNKTPVTNYTVTYTGTSFTLTVTKLETGSYELYYKTQDYYGTEDNHSFPQGSTIDIVNHTELIVDGRRANDDASYPIVTEGLPMLKEALNGYYEDGHYIIPWKIYINRNELGQTNNDIETGADAVVTEVLPDKLVYLEGSSVITKADGTTFKSEPKAEKSAELGDVLKWNFKWEKAGDNFYVLEFKSYIADEYLTEIKKMSQADGSATVSFDNNVIATVGGSIGGTNASAVEDFTFLKKTSGLNEDAQRIDYEIVVNREAVDLKTDSDTIVLEDKLTNGFFVAGSLKVYYYGTEKEVVLPEDAVKSYDEGRRFKITVPDATALLVKYSVNPDTDNGTEIDDSTVAVSVSNTATLHADIDNSSKVEKEYAVKDVSAKISSSRGSVKITKVDAESILTGLEGCEIGLYRVDLKTGESSLVSEKTTTEDEEYAVIFDVDGKYNSLIFDTLYYYQEKVAPKNYQIDETKHYFLFKGTKFDKIDPELKALLGEDYENVTFIEPKKGHSRYEFTFTNKKLPDEPGPGPEP